jgi:hypothetical protein
LIKWKEELEIHANIERVWRLFQDENIQKIMPKIEDHQVVEKKNNTLGAKHAQSYTEGNQMITYIVETVNYVDEPDRKLKHTRFQMSGTIEVEYIIRLEKMTNLKTKLIYEGSNKGMTVTAKLMLMAGSKSKRDETVKGFMDRVKREALLRN